MTKLYSILGLKPDCEQGDIRPAYLRAANEHHPDKGGDEELFKEIQHAYAVLKNPELRARYDQVGDEETVSGPSAMSVLMSALSAVIEATSPNDLEYLDIEGAIRTGFETKIRQGRELRSARQKKISFLLRISGRAGEGSPIHNYTSAAIRTLEHEIKAIDKEIDLLDEAIALTKTIDYRFEREKPEPDLAQYVWKPGQPRGYR